MTIVESLKRILSGGDLTRSEAVAVMDHIMSGNCTPAQTGGWLVALRQKGETADELAGFVESMRGHSVTIETADECAVDGCGTGGDESHSFNISTAAAVVAAGAGATVAKHGNRSVSSACGSADLLEAAGGKIDAEPKTVKKTLDRTGFGFMFAPRFHPAMKHAVGPRRELGIRTVFNILGPMTNPASVKRQVIGVYDGSVMKLMADVLMKTGSVHALIVHSRDGLDEISVCAPTDFFECKDGQLSSGSIAPADVGITEHAPGSLSGGGAEENVKILRELLDGKRSAYYDAAVLNAAAMLYVSGRTDSIQGGVALADVSLQNGTARRVFAEWIKESREE